MKIPGFIKDIIGPLREVFSGDKRKTRDSKKEKFNPGEDISKDIEQMEARDMKKDSSGWVSQKREMGEDEE